MAERTKAPGLLARLRQRHEWLDRLIRAANRYQSQYGDYYAAAITYFSVLALVPLLMIAFAIAGFVLGGNPDLLAQLRNSITTAVPNPAMSQMLNNVVDQAIGQAGAVGIIGLVAALYSGLSWMTNLREALTALWTQEPEQQPVLRKYVSDLLSLIGLGLAMGISFGISAVGGGVGRMLLELAGIDDTPFARAGLQVLATLLSLAASWLVFLWILARLPRKPVSLRSAVWGALFGAVGFEILKQVGVFYLNSVTGSPAAAAFGPILGLLVFSYLTSRFILFVTAWTASAPENQERAVPSPPEPAVIRPVVQTRGRTGPAATASLFGLGVLAGLAWRRRR
ncbi:membrane protein [Saccharopolyspora erythraea NRRL 2338]|uniref:Possible tRNA-processing ribonuclease BN n=2 Tax=Saccharopolyspora erythraea TaxID=1836 RepID=A4FNY3_SACEN|nr:inner membrane protein YhjD [Saccharopolyspora erythraea]EQD86526.1 trehalose-6-phosphate synthase [Saccharopolyspora erythraea D]PFG99399.1 membrane protein [Saccharopolyspora erythraea NRRL 2338]QRK89316.1 inner membrane protein YhjD [Saccharopolyspora erythraea]CAM05758.1 possible tRNA-processing ribonuclease BN [Saccharopolyspora erythraea NRRL 2338]